MCVCMSTRGLGPGLRIDVLEVTDITDVLDIVVRREVSLEIKRRCIIQTEWDFCLRAIASGKAENTGRTPPVGE